MAQRQDPPRTPRYGAVSDEEIQRRWRGLTPMVSKWLVICAVAAPALFFLNRLGHLEGTTRDYVNVAFQIAVGGVVLFAFLTGMAWLFGRGGKS